MRDQDLPVVTYVSRTRRERCLERRSRRALGQPTDALQVGTRIGGREIGDVDEMDARGLWHLRKIHRAELASTDQAYTEWPALRRTLTELRIKIHGYLRPSWQVQVAMPPRGYRPARAAARRSPAAGSHRAGTRSA